jgi:hypothetical protein
MHEDTSRPEQVPLRALSGETEVYDRERRRPVLRLGGVVVLPVGATVELPASSHDALVVGVRLRRDAPDGGEALTVRLEVDIPAAYWDVRAVGATLAVPAPIAAATADLDLNPDGDAPLGMPLS